jgi:thymidylate synthase
MVPGAMLRFDLRDGFPAVTTKQLAFKAVKGELIGFLRGYDNAADFRNLECNIWDKNANDPGKEGSPNAWLTNANRKGEDDLGRIYGVQWRNWRGKAIGVRADPIGRIGSQIMFNSEIEYVYIDQVQDVLNKLKNNPTDRRMIINAWRPDEFMHMALPPCHVLYQFLADTKNKVLHLCMYQRSCDMFLGVPFNIASASLFLSIMAKLSGFTAGTFTHFLADAHIYVNHLDQVKEQLSRTPYELPKLEITMPDTNPLVETDWAFKIQPEHFNLVNYQRHPTIKAEMAV